MLTGELGWHALIWYDMEIGGKEPSSLFPMTTIATIIAGQILQAGDNKFIDMNEFLGFGTDSDTPVYSTLSQLKSNVADPDAHYAIFRNVTEDYTWAAYRFNGRWRVGSSARSLKLIG